jgi:hypothetical protein
VSRQGLLKEKIAIRKDSGRDNCDPHSNGDVLKRIRVRTGRNEAEIGGAYLVAPPDCPSSTKKDEVGNGGEDGP